VNTEDNVLHVLIGLLGLAAFFASGETSGEEPVPPREAF
jgi:hypothetical protein